MKLTNNMVYFDKSTLQKLEAQLAEVQNTYMGTIRHNTVQDAVKKLEDRARDTTYGYRGIFQSAFRNLEDHVSDVQYNCRNNIRKGNFQKLYRSPSVMPVPVSDFMPSQPPRSDVDMRSYYNSLCSSLQVFQIRRWRPLTANYRPQTSSTRCRPVNERPRSSPGTYLNLQPRPGSEPENKCSLQSFLKTASLFPRPPDTLRVNDGNFDTLLPRSVSYFVNDPRPVTPTSAYGDIVQQTSLKENVSKKSIEKADVLNGDFSSTSGIDSDAGNSEVGEEDEVYGNGNDNDSISELEKGNEPPVDHSMQLPDLYLPPEKLDHIYTPESNGDMASFDFDAESPGVPLYEFGCPIPSPLDKINLRLHAKENSDWRHGIGITGPVDPVVSAVFDRLVELEKLQIETQDWEERRVRLMKKRPVSRSNKSRNRKCCDACLQPTCVGNCPNKRVDANGSEKTRQISCTDAGKDTRCEQRIRQPVEETKLPAPPREELPQHCKSGQKRHTAKIINANHVLLGRPKSALSTFNRCRSSSKLRDLKPESASNISDTLSKNTEKLGLEPSRPMSHSNAKQPQPGNRGDMNSKSCISNRNQSQPDLLLKRRSLVKANRQVHLQQDLT